MQESIVEGFRLSQQQQRLYALQESVVGQPFQAHIVIRIEGQLNLAALQTALTEIIQRHEILRTIYHRLPGMKAPLQVIGPAEYAWQAVDVTGEAQEDLVVAQMLAAAAARPFDYAHGPVLHIFLGRLSPVKHLLLLHAPTLCVDLASLHRLITELHHAYANRQRGEEGEEESPLQYVDFAEWQHELLKSDEAQPGLAYWSRQQMAEVPVLQLPGFQQKTKGSFSPKTYETVILAPFVEQLTQLAGQWGASLDLLLLTAWQVLLARMSSQYSFLLGLESDGRLYEELQNAVGLYGRCVPLPCQLLPQITFPELLAQTAAAVSEALEWQDTFTWEHINWPQPADHPPFLPYSFHFADAYPQVADAGLTLTVVSRQAFVDRFHVKLTCYQQRDELITAFAYDTAVFAEADVTRLAAQFQALLADLRVNPQAPAAYLAVLDEAQRRQLLVHHNDTRLPYPQDQCFHDLFAAQARRTPQRVAVVYEDQQVTYAGLNRRANQLAHYLRSIGVGPEVKVGLWLDRSPDMVVALLGILKAGGAYVPLDPVYPQERLAFVMQDTAMPVLLTQPHLAAALTQTAVQVLCLDELQETLRRQPADDPHSLTHADNSAYVIYTSGSTGTPKGVLVAHRSPINLLSALNDLVYGQAAAIGLQASLNAPLMFDASMQQLILLLNGHTLHIIPQAVRADGDAFLAYLRAHPLDALDCTPSQLRLWLASGLLQSEAAPAIILSAGEAIDEAAWQELAAAPATKIYNIYGPTECTVDATGVLIRTDIPRPTIGQPLGNYRTYILDHHLQPVPIGVPGELYIGGPGVARGYLFRPGLTAAKFVPDPFADEPGLRLYKTGDLARFMPDSNIEFLERIDHQVKLRGYRIELGEIEATLKQHPAVRDCVVMVYGEESDQKLAAYIVTEAEIGDSDAWREFLRLKLPDYMIPAAYVALDELPLTPNGKVDRHALPAPTAVQARHRALTAPRTPVEALLANIWAEVLGLEEVGIDEDFFAAGGYSLLVTKLIARIRETFAVEVPVRKLFESPTIADLAQTVTFKQREAEGLALPPLKPASRTGPLPLSFSQQRLWFLDRLEEQNPAYNISNVIHIEGPLQAAVLEQSLQAIIERHEVLRTVFAQEQGEPVQVVMTAMPWNLVVVDLSQFTAEGQQEEIMQWQQQEMIRPFNLTQGPLLRATLLRLSPSEHILLFIVHHIVSDAWSASILVRELTILYDALLQGEPALLPELPIQYADFACWQRHWLQGDVLQKQLTYWRNHLENIDEVLLLPTDYPRRPLQSYQGASTAFTIPSLLVTSLRALSRQANATLFMTLLAAFQTLLHRYTGQDVIRVGSPIANRILSETEPLIGCFVNTLVFQTNVKDDPAFQELLSRTRAETIEAYAHQDMPFELLVEALQPQRDLSHPPLFQVMLVFLNTEQPVLELRDLTLRQIPLEAKTAKYDVTMYLKDADGDMHGVLEYNTDLFRTESIERMLDQFQELLNGIVTDPGQRLSSLPLLTTTEQQLVTRTWNDTARYQGKAACLHTRFDQQAAQTPAATALISGTMSISYAELEQRANQMAHYLLGQGVRPGTCVGVCLPRSIDLVVSLLGVLKAGGAYVPLDPSYPQQRLAFMQQDSGAVLLVTTATLAERYLAASPVVCVDSDWEQISQQPVTAPAVAVGPEAAAYIVYTSGSTGKPKGVVGLHQNTINRCRWMWNKYPFSADDICCHKTAISFVDAVWELWGPLLRGVTAVILDETAVQDTRLLVAALSQHQVTRLVLVPSLLRSLLANEEAMATALPSLWLWVCSGEALPLALAHQFQQQLPGRTLLNLYGSSEVAADVTYYEVSGAETEQIPIGRPIDNVQVYVLDEGMRPAPIGVVGELYAGGECLSRGYHLQPGQTAARFLPDPFSQIPGARLFKTGDRCRWLADGQLEYLGRGDYQVKIRGHRIELQEIEAALRQHPLVAETAVHTHPDVDGALQLVAYVVLKPGQDVSSSELRTFLQQQLPTPMTPGAFVIMPALPLTPSGKLDRLALPAPGTDRPELVTHYVPANTPIETDLSQLWQQLLQVQQVGIYDNFFELGGHSLLATRLMSQISDAFGMDIPLIRFFAEPTVKGLATAIEENLFTQAQTERLDELLDLLESTDEDSARQSLGLD